MSCVITVKEYERPVPEGTSGVGLVIALCICEHQSIHFLASFLSPCLSLFPVYPLSQRFHTALFEVAWSAGVDGDMNGVARNAGCPECCFLAVTDVGCVLDPES